MSAATTALHVSLWWNRMRLLSVADRPTMALQPHRATNAETPPILYRALLTASQALLLRK